MECSEDAQAVLSLSDAESEVQARKLACRMQIAAWNEISCLSKFVGKDGE